MLPGQSLGGFALSRSSLTAPSTSACNSGRLRGTRGSDGGEGSGGADETCVGSASFGSSAIATALARRLVLAAVEHLEGGTIARHPFARGRRRVRLLARLGLSR